ncbi:FAD-dependent oxidoreductase [Actinoplanes philippinensis]|uniref:2-polyprenyl-6-methoxyphenol hydroxylase n=1 Tax=Actinoplanes philippinensis TaxID=35752 RepID=A0A1I2FYG0_9ACTN|nr:FAD-dependent monooxygenase [Actinoplanes philippinensis]GIE76402.1 FAD-dependent oxidoreductase [Actinoplanes philippinensis]SFF09837.1 2-polyprenyl-6-methoxyphenol hydroxylase [Actinoplanes philippinensis]
MRIPVIISGGGLVGLTAALLLRAHDVEVLLVERHGGTSPLPKARRFNTRTMEVYRQLGIADEVERAAADLADFQAMRAGPTLIESQVLPGPPAGDVSDLVAASPMLPCLCAQDALEPVLRELAAQRGADLRFGHELAGFTQDARGVTATVTGPDGPYRVDADYLVAADGARSPIREALGITRTGRGTLGRATTVYFRADLGAAVHGREFNLCQLDDARTPGALVSINGTDRWQFMTDVVGVAEADWPAHLRRVIGLPDLGIELITVQDWEPTMKVADRYRAGRVFLAGDAAHVMPPFAAQGANTGIQDAHNLAWKLAMVLRGDAGPGLLDSYHTERHPIGLLAAEQSSLRSGDLRAPTGFGSERPELVHPFVLMLSYGYTDGALVPDGGPPFPTDRLELVGRPGTRVPHLWLQPGLSTLDLCGTGFTVFSGGADVPGFEAHPMLGLDHDEVMVVRPDQVVAWRGRARDAIDRVLERLTGRMG